jgi:hypothetical protein
VRTFLSPFAWTAEQQAAPAAGGNGPQWVWPVTTRQPRSFTPRIRDEFIVETGHSENENPYLDTGVP